MIALVWQTLSVSSSWIQTISPSLVKWKSPSIPSTPSSQDTSKAGSEFSGNVNETPRCAIIIKPFYIKSKRNLIQLEK